MFHKKLVTAAVLGSNGIVPEDVRKTKIDEDVVWVAESSLVCMFFSIIFIYYIYSIHEMIYEIMKYKKKTNIRGTEL